MSLQSKIDYIKTLSSKEFDSNDLEPLTVGSSSKGN